MKSFNYIWKYFLAGTFIFCMNACSNDAENTLTVEKTEVSRTVITVEKTIELTEPGTLQAKLEEAMGDKDVSTL